MSIVSNSIPETISYDASLFILIATLWVSVVIYLRSLVMTFAISSILFLQNLYTFPKKLLINKLPSVIIVIYSNLFDFFQ